MKLRILAAAAAVVLAIIGATVLSGYVAGADQRALQGAKAVQVFIVQSPVPAGTPAEKVAPLVSHRSLPASAVAEGAVTDLAQITGKVSSTDLVPGEQLISGRFVDPASLKNKDTGQVPLPPGMQEVTIQLEPQRVLGGQLTAGDTVGVIFSFNITASGAPGPPTTHLQMHKVLVTSVQGAPAAATPSTGSGQAGAAPAVPAGSVLVTLARTSPDVEQIVYAAEFGKIWLSKEPSTATESGTRQLYLGGVLK